MNRFVSYLSNRQQAADSGKGLSEFEHVKSGAPQGPILGPTFFLLFINDLSFFMKYCYSDFFADDATFHSHDKTLRENRNELQSGAVTAKGWSRQNKMHIHYGKTNHMILGAMHKLNNNYEFDLKIDSNQIKKTRSQNLLGMYIDHLCSTISSKISLLRQLSSYVSIDIQLKFYQGYIQWCGGLPPHQTLSSIQTSNTRSPYNITC